MKTSKRFLTLGIVTIIAMFLLAACGTSGGGNAEGENGTNALDTIKENDKIVFGVKNDTRLFGLKNPSTGEIEGFDIDISKAIAKEILGDENKVEFKEVTSKTRIPLLNNGDVDAVVATMTITEERKKEVDFSDVYFDAGQSLLVKTDSPIKGVEDIDGSTTVLAVKGSTSSKNIREAAPDAKVSEYENYTEAFSALKAGQGDALTTDDAILYGMADEDPSFHLVGETFTEEPYGIAVKKGNTELVEAINDALKKLKDSGEYDQIKDKWIKQDSAS